MFERVVPSETFFALGKMFHVAGNDVGLETGHDPLAEGGALARVEPEGVGRALFVAVDVVDHVGEHPAARDSLEQGQDVDVLLRHERQEDQTVECVHHVTDRQTREEFLIILSYFFRHIEVFALLLHVVLVNLSEKLVFYALLDVTYVQRGVKPLSFFLFETKQKIFFVFQAEVHLDKKVDQSRFVLDTEECILFAFVERLDPG